MRGSPKAQSQSTEGCLDISQVTRERIRQIEAKAILKLRSKERSGILRDYISEQPQDVTWRASMTKART